MHRSAIGAFLDELAARTPTPGGGASSALHAAQAAALVGMVGRYSDGAKYAEHADTIGRIVAESDDVREAALAVAARDAAAFEAVGHAYALPRGTEPQEVERRQAIERALVASAAPPVEVVELTDRIVGLAEGLLPIGNRNVVTDIACAAEAARAAAVTARVNIEINRAGIKDEPTRTELAAQAARVQVITKRAERVTSAVLEGISK
ncbi:formimidoyltetrahydrofolate cyclodeaminase [Actinoalloteichus sp. AHMU CJ021]|uniref:cyclodeaminase/cyclohydrolase family protein n=1 Tax=Actinoalloteichus sp. AHMU CJ021 TaxID=2072503 RepID=UPI000CA011D8|nr:formimidoyltetrahydrofolate cyclodeaminase [Actinoalloteichus sp. AHMU CJ021]